MTVTGTNLAGATAVRFGTTAGTKLTVISAGKLTVVAPKERAGQVDIRVTTSGGTSAVTKADRFTFVALPTVTAISPASGSHRGGAKVTITGTDLSGATKVTFGSAAAAHLQQVSSTKLTVTSPPHAAGAVDVRVTTAGGTSTKHHADQFSYR